jgi:hypothetical protein
MGPHGLSTDLPSPRRGIARYVKCRGVHRSKLTIRVSTSALRATSPDAENGSDRRLATISPYRNYPLSCSENNYQRRRSREKREVLLISYAAYVTVRVAVPLNCWYPAVPSGFTTA